MSDSGPLVEYDSRWPAQFEEEKARILAAIGSRVVAIEHIGSTSVPSMSAKPPIDILVAVHSLDDAKECVEPLRELSYEYKPMEEVLTPGTKYFRKGPSGASTHHIRIVEAGSELWHHYLLFRDHLRNHPDEARKYLELKKELHGKFGRHLPMDAKTSYIGSVLAKARSREKLGH